MKSVTITYERSWLMGIDPIATGKQLQKLRREHHLTQEDLSYLFEQGGDSASRVIISMWENGKKMPSLSHVVFLAELYDCSLDELVISYRRSREADDRDQPVLFFQVNIYIFKTNVCKIVYIRLLFCQSLVDGVIRK